MIIKYDVEVLLDLLGIEADFYGFNKRGKWVALCPNPKHDDKNPSWSINDNPGNAKNGSHYCFSCGYGGGPWELAAAVWDCSVTEAGRRLSSILKEQDSKLPEIFAITLKEQNKLSPRLKWPLGCTFPGKIESWYKPALKYLYNRGVTNEQILKYELGYSIRGRLKHRIIVPIYTCGRLVTYVARIYLPGEPRYKMAKSDEPGVDSKVAIFGEKFFDTKINIVTIAEGSFSMLALDRAGAPNPCAILGSNLTPEKSMILSQFDNIIIASDPDAAGDKLANEIQTMGRNKKVLRLQLEKSPDDTSYELLRNSIKGAMKQLLIPR